MCLPAQEAPANVPIRRMAQCAHETQRPRREIRYSCWNISEITNASLKVLYQLCMLVFNVIVNGSACDCGVCMFVS